MKGTRKLITGIVMVVLGASVVMAGGQGEDAGGRDSAALSERHGGVLQVAQTTDIRSSDPTSLGQASELIYRQVFDTLITLSKDGNLTPEPLLAESWEWNQDKTVLTFNLREGVTFHSGREMTATDVIRNIEYLQSADVGSKLRGTLASIVAMDAVDDYTVRLELDQFNAALIGAFTMLWIIDSDVLGSDDMMVGTGPFTWDEWIPGTSVTLSRYDGYWDGDLPYLDEIQILAQPDAQTMLANLESGAIDIAKFPPLSEVPRIQEQDNLDVVVSDVHNTFYAVGFNTQDDVLDDARVRRALAYTMPRERFVESHLYGISRAQSTLFATTSAAYDEELNDYYAYNLDQARELLGEAGYTDGFDTSIMVAPSLDENHLRFVVMWQQELEKIGVNMEINQVERAVWVDNKRGASFPHMLADLYGRAQKEPVEMLLQSLPFVPEGNPARFVNEEYQQLIRDASTEASVEARNEIYRQLNDLLLTEAFEVPIAPQVRTWAMRSDIAGFDFNIDNREVFRSTYFED